MKIFYHANCMDGLFSAAAMYQSMSEEALAEAKFIPIQYGSKPELQYLKDETVYMLDFSFKRPEMLEIANTAQEVVVIDHHDSAERELVDLPDNVECNFDMNHSGAVLTYQYFNPSSPVPDILKYVEDRDLWKWQLENSQEINEGLRFYYNPSKTSVHEAPNIERTSLDDEFYGELFDAGSILVQQIQTAVEKALSKYWLEDINGYTVPVINSTQYVSEIGGALAKNYPFAAVKFQTDADTIVYSLRSAPYGIEVNRIAEENGGGGHPHAAGFTVKASL